MGIGDGKVFVVVPNEKVGRGTLKGMTNFGEVKQLHRGVLIVQDEVGCMSADAEFHKEIVR